MPMDSLVIKQEVIDLESSDSEQEDGTESLEQQPLFISLQPAAEPPSTTVESTNDSMYTVYTYQLPEPELNTSSHEIVDFEGQYEFQLKHPREDGSRISKGAAWTYSSITNELYVRMNVDCPLLFNVKGRPPLGTFIRATPVFTRADDMLNYPKRCLNHAAEHHETNRGHPKPEHLIRCYLAGTGYTKDEATGRMSTILPFVPPGLDSSFSAYVVRFMCRTSCPGGMNRKPMSVVFTLEYNGKCLGRQMRKVKVCACPGRDRHTEELRLERSTRETSTFEIETPSPPPPPPPPSLPQDVRKVYKRNCTNLSSSTNEKQRKLYTLTVRSKLHYNILSALIPILDQNLGSREESSDDEG